MFLSQNSSSKKVALGAVIAVVLVVGIGALFFHKHTVKKAAAHTAEMSHYCIGQQFAAGASGPCVSDVQMLVNYMEHSGLTECPFEGSATLTVSGVYDQATAAQVTSIQKWSDCYAQQEGFKSNVKQTGDIDQATWGELCTFGYTDPKQRADTNATASIAAGNNAGCAQLHKESAL